MSAYPIGGRPVTIKMLIDHALENGYQLIVINDTNGHFVKRALVKGKNAVALPFGGEEDDAVIINLEAPALLSRLDLGPIP